MSSIERLLLIPVKYHSSVDFGQAWPFGGLTVMGSWRRELNKMIVSDCEIQRELNKYHLQNWGLMRAHVTYRISGPRIRNIIMILQSFYIRLRPLMNIL